MTQLRRQHEELLERDVTVVVVGPEKRAAFDRYWRDHEIPFVGVPDPEHEVADVFGQEFKLLQLGRMPAQVIVDREGMVRYAHYGHSMADIPSNTELLELLDELSKGRAPRPQAER